MNNLLLIIYAFAIQIRIYFLKIFLQFYVEVITKKNRFPRTRQNVYSFSGMD